jgi:hypothetical protein
MTVGFLSYQLGDKQAAVEAFLKAKSLNLRFKEAWDAAMRRPDNKALSEDAEVLRKLFP